MSSGLYLRLNREPVGELVYEAAEDKFCLKLNDENLKLSPFVTAKAQSAAVKRFLMNLLPEGTGLEELSTLMQISKNNVYGLIHAIGSETTGALSFYAVQGLDDTTSFREITPEEMTDRIQKRMEIPITVWDGKPRLSVAGVQEKLPVLITQDGIMGFGEGRLASTHLFKFGKKPNQHMVLNEHICMNLAAKLKLPAAETEILRFGDEPVLSVKRFDRIQKADRVDRIHIIDGCQMLDLSPSYKYERPYGDGRDVKNIREGASLPKLFKAAELCAVPAAAMRDIINWVILNLIIGNSDAHGKNISFYFDKGKVKVAPMYDLLSIEIYGEEYATKLAMAIGDNFSNDIYPYDLAEMCEVCELNKGYVAKTIISFAKKIISLADSVIDLEKLTSAEQGFAAELLRKIKNNAEKYTYLGEDLKKIKTP